MKTTLLRKRFRTWVRNEYYTLFGAKCANDQCGKVLLPEDTRTLRTTYGHSEKVCAECFQLAQHYDVIVRLKR